MIKQAKKKRLLLLVIPLVIFAALLCACEEGLQTKDVRLTSYPDRIVYIKGVDTELDLRGGAFEVEVKSGAVFKHVMDDHYLSGNYYTEVDFDTEGVYEVSLYYDGFYLYFPIQVISPESFQRLQQSQPQKEAGP